MNVYGYGVVFYFIILIGIGFYSSMKVKNVEDYLVSGRNAGKLLFLGTFVATFSSASIWIGMPGYFYKWGWCQLWQGPGTVLAPIIMMLFIGPYLRRFAQFTLPDFFVARYQSKTLRIITAIVILFLYYTILVAQAMGGARVLQMALGWDYKLALITLFIVFTLYTWRGGTYAVVRTDTFQFLVMCIGGILATIYCLLAAGGLVGMNLRLAAIDPNLVAGDGGGIMPISMILAWTMIWGLGNPAQPYTITRFYTAKDTKTAVYSAGVGAFSLAIFIIITAIVGNTARIFYPNLESIDLAFPIIAKNLLPVPIGILMMCGLIGAVISTTDSLLVTAGATLGRDFYQRLINTKASQKQVTSFSRWGIVVLSVVGFLTALNPPGPVITITAFAWSILASSFFIPLVAGIHFKKATKVGAFMSMIGGCIMSLVWFVLNKPLGIHPVLIGVFVSALLMVIGSIISEEQDVTDLWRKIHPQSIPPRKQ